MTAEVLLQDLVSGLLMGFVYTLIAAGLSLIFGLMEIVNFAHGEFLMLAIFSTYWAWALWRLDPVVSLPLTAAALFLLGVVSARDQAHHMYPSLGMGAVARTRYPEGWRVWRPCIARETPSTPCCTR